MKLVQNVVLIVTGRQVSLPYGCGFPSNFCCIYILCCYNSTPTDNGTCNDTSINQAAKQF